jgi:hypothetical protein
MRNEAEEPPAGIEGGSMVAAGDASFEKLLALPYYKMTSLV